MVEKIISFSDVRLWKHSIIGSVFRGVKGLYEYPVVYTDGLISRCKKDKAGRKPWGILFRNRIVALNDAPEKMTFAAAEHYCQDAVFAGEYCVVEDFELLERLNKQIYKINRLLQELGGTPLKNDYYLSRTLCARGHDVVKMNGLKNRNIRYAAPEDRVCFRPMIDLRLYFR